MAAVSHSRLHVLSRIKAIAPLPHQKSGLQLSFSSIIPAAFSVHSHPNGGQLSYAAISSGLSLSKKASHPDILSMQCTFLRPSKENHEAVFTSTLLSSSKTQTTVQSTVSQDGAMTAIWLCTFGNASVNASRKGFSILPSKSPSYPIFSLSDRGSTASPLTASAARAAGEDLVDLCELALSKFPTLSIASENRLLVSKSCNFVTSYLQSGPGASVASVARISGYAGLAVGGSRPPPDVGPDDDLALLPPATHRQTLAYLFDAFPPPVLALDPAGWVPTVSYSAHFFAEPKLKDDGLLPITFETNVCDSGVLECRGTAWCPETGACVGTSTQIARLWKK